jgi:hypothetical protein
MQVKNNTQEMATELAEIEKNFSERALCVKQKYDRALTVIQLEKQQAIETYNLKYMDYEVSVTPKAPAVPTVAVEPIISTEAASVRAAWPFPTDRAT